MHSSDFVGTWELVSFSTRDLDTGEIRYPLGPEPAGLIIYSDDGYISAQLTGGTPPDDYFAYGGRFTFDAASATLHHDVTISILPELLTAPQFRQASLEGDRLTLSATTTDQGGERTISTLLWRRAPRNDWH
jgi:hypothetical protein